jgi:hypothetical protein
MKLIIKIMIFLSLSPIFLAFGSCKEIEPRRPGGGVIISEAGSYCMNKDIHMKGWYMPFSHGSDWHADDVILLLLTADNITLDLQGHSLSSNAKIATAGIENPIDGYPYHMSQYPLRKLKIAPKPSNIVIKNGYLNLESNSRRGYGIQFSYYFDDAVSIYSDITGKQEYQTKKKQDESGVGFNKEWTLDLINKLPKKSSDYVSRKIKIENMKIKSSDVGIIIQGADTVITGNTIEVESGTAIWIYGPNAVIENNTIIVRGTEKLLDADAPIRLHHGDGAIIRNNKIIVDGKAHKRIVSTFDTESFIFEKNKLFGLEENTEVFKAFLGGLKIKIKENIFSKRIP